MQGLTPGDGERGQRGHQDTPPQGRWLQDLGMAGHASWPGTKVYDHSIPKCMEATGPPFLPCCSQAPELSRAGEGAHGHQAR